jgi:hypothetical protein
MASETNTQEIEIKQDVPRMGRYGNNVDESRQLYCCGLGCQWCGLDCESGWWDSCACEGKLTQWQCSCVNDVVGCGHTCMACQYRVCCLNMTMAIPSNDAAPLNCGIAGASCFPEAKCCKQVGVVSGQAYLTDSSPSLVEINPLPYPYLCGALCCHVSLFKV